MYVTVFLAYFAFLLFVGYLQKDRNASGADFFRSGGSAPWWIVGSSVLMAGVSAYTFTGASGVAFDAGWSVLAIYLTGIAGLLLSVITAPWFRQLRATTAPEVVRMRFDGFTQKTVALVALVQGTLLSGLPIYALAAFCTGVFGFNLQLTIFAVGLVVCLYATVGGKWAVLSCDFVQGILLFSITLLVFGFALWQIGGPVSLFDHIESAGLGPDFALFKSDLASPWVDYSLMWMFALLVLNFFVTNSLMAAPRYFSVRNGKEARKAAIFSMVIFLLGTFVWFIPPIVARILMPEAVMAAALPSPREAAYAIFALEVLPPPLMALMIVGIFSATTSTLDSGLNSASAIIVRDLLPWFWQKLGWRPISESAEVFAGRVCTLLLGVVITGIALFYSTLSTYSIFDLMLKNVSLFSVPLSLPLMLCLFFRRVPRWSGWATMVFSLVVSLGIFLFENVSGTRVPFAGALILNAALTTAFFLATQLFWSLSDATYRGQVDKFFALMHTPVREDEIPEAERDGSVGRIAMGKSLMVLGVLLLALALATIGQGGTLWILFLAAATGFPGWVLFLHGKRAAKK